ncbi:carboxypeptidase-like regulatory domain-containing protein [Hymenobacter persicinus]|uniref:Carboxypeptidase-like regulatory domain-containing protein n=1 Tax=Hymenobacter persicinus TaxID=2025506 RepID=A0A4Q5L6X7_9BACT|nr:carboxypeptidase-like regulatory domain-containing protein [Hymenobacter persicinus]RYU75324.1 carboxypeptidase-like regulatory domain-containing protein [Hymenobacter persicinus]
MIGLFRFGPRPLLSCLTLVLLLLLSGAAAAQVRVTGTISTLAGRKPIPGAAVLIQGTRKGTVADNEGDFAIDVANTDTLMFRAVGFKPQRLPLDRTGLSQIIVQIYMVRDSIQLGEVRIQSGRPDRAQINRALRNVRRPAPSTNVVRRPPPPKPLFPVDTIAPKMPVPTIASPVSLIYEQFSRAGQERRKMEEILNEKKVQEAEKARQKYNRNFKDNKGYE